MRIITGLLITGLLALALSAQTITLSTDAKQWESYGWYIPGPKLYNNGGVTFDFPTMPKNVTYVGVRKKLNIDTKHYVSFSVQLVTTGNPAFDYDTEPSYNTCIFPAHARAYLEETNWQRGGEFYRWWSNPDAMLLDGAGGTFHITIPLTPDKWSSVYGKYGTADAQSLAGWHKALKNLGWIGFSIGGGCFFGHGVGIDNGTAQFIVLGYTVY